MHAPTPNERNSFTLRARWETQTPGTYYTFTCAADTLLDDANGVGLVEAFIKDKNGDFVVTNDGVGDITMDGQPSYAESLNGSYAYYPVRGGLPDGVYTAVLQFTRLNGTGQYDPRLSTAIVKIKVTDQKITFE